MGPQAGFDSIPYRSIPEIVAGLFELKTSGLATVIGRESSLKHHRRVVLQAHGAVAASSVLPDILLCVVGDPRWRMPDLQPADWVNYLVRSEIDPTTFVDNPITTTVKRDENALSPMIDVGVGKFKVANRGTAPAWPVFTLSAPTSGRTAARW